VDGLDAEVLRRLVERRVSAERQNHLGIADPLLFAGPVARRFDGHQDALRAAGRHVADRLGLTEQTGGHSDDFGLELLEALEGVGAEAVGEDRLAVGVAKDLRHVVAGVVDEAPDAASHPVGIVLQGVVEFGVDLIA
jgi:hypothetical protein